MDGQEIGPGADISESIRNAISTADHVIAILSNDSASPWVLAEIGMALGQRKKPTIVYSDDHRRFRVTPRVDSSLAWGTAIDLSKYRSIEAEEPSAAADRIIEGLRAGEASEETPPKSLI